MTDKPGNPGPAGQGRPVPNFADFQHQMAAGK
jgi:hypothetical protein